MVPDDERPLAERLGERLGVDVDPRISLDASSEVRREAPPAAEAPSSGLLGRLAERPVISSRYRVDGEIARGGMGAILDVWDHDVRRHLAMKVALTRDADGSSATGARSDELDPRLLARFLEEAQVTGQLEHPGIVPVHEFGMDENGRVFFTMRRVHGHDLERVFGLVDRGEDGWSVLRAIGVLQKVCEAMAYAHTKGVVHRDLKPANVMVGAFGEVYVMDWGLVRVAGHDDRHDLRVEVDPREAPTAVDGDALYTMDGDVLGTPAYMSPEQARGEVSSLDARSDVYAMGAIMYRLLAGHPPYYDGGERPGALALLGALREGPPTSLASLAPSAAPELVAIAEKAMAREPGDRYASMVELEQDLRAFVEQRVVGAYETGAWAETRKWVRRNRPLAASLAAVVVALAVGLAFSLVEKRRADDNAALAQRNERQANAAAAEAEEQRALAEEAAAEAARQARIAAEVNAFLNDDLLMAASPDVGDRDATVREVLDTAADRLDGRFADEPLVEAELRHTIGNAYWTLGRYSVALGFYERAVDLRRAELGDRAHDTLESMASLASCLDDAGRSEEALELFEHVLATSEEMSGPDSAEVVQTLCEYGTATMSAGRPADAVALLEDARARLGRSMLPDSSLDLLVTSNLGLAYRAVGRLHDARDAQERTLTLRRRRDGDAHPETLTAMSNLASTYLDLGEYERGRDLERASVELRSDVLGPDHVMTGQGLYNLGIANRQLGDSVRAEQQVREGVAIMRAELGDTHWRVLKGEDNHATLLGDLGRGDESLAQHERVLERAIPALGPEHEVTMACLANVAIGYLKAGRLAEAEQAHEALLVVERRVRGDAHPATLTTLENYGNVLFSMGDHDGAFEALEEVFAGRRQALGERHPDVAKTAMNLALVTRSAGRPELARERFEEAIGRWREATAMHAGYYADCLHNAGELARAAGDHAEALAYLEEAIEFRDDEGRLGELHHVAALAARGMQDFEYALGHAEGAYALRTDVYGDDDLGTLASLWVRGDLLRRLARFDEAERDLLAFVERLAAAHGDDHPYIANGRSGLFDLYADWGRPDEADRWRD